MSSFAEAASPFGGVWVHGPEWVVRMDSLAGPVGRRGCSHPRGEDTSAVNRGFTSGVRRFAFQWMHPRVCPSSGSRCLLWECASSLSVGQPGSGSYPAGGALSGAARECWVPDLAVLVSLAVDGRRGRLSGAAVAWFGRRALRSSSFCRLSDASRQGGCRRRVISRGVGFGSHGAASVVGYLLSDLEEVTSRGGHFATVLDSG